MRDTVRNCKLIRPTGKWATLFGADTGYLGNIVDLGGNTIETV